MLKEIIHRKLYRPETKIYLKKGIYKGKIKSFIFLILIDLTDNSLFKIIIATMYLMTIVCG